MKVILFVDDENLILRGLKKIFDDNSHHYVYRNSAIEALEYMKEKSVDLLCTDIVMPEIDGFKLLRRVKELYPETIRVALTSMHNNQVIKQLINENLAQLYQFKPWHDIELKRNIFKILNMKSAMYSNETLQLLQSLNSLPTLPKIYSELSEMMIKDEPIDEIANVIEEDPSITSVILRVANSAFYGRQTGSIHQAIMNIGLNNLKLIILANSVFQELTEDMGMLMDIWIHATNTNKLVTAIYSECLKKPIPSLFTSVGLLHDIGKVILYHNYDDYREILSQSIETKQSLIELEHEKLGVSHQDLGAYLLNLWDLPFAYVEVAMFHHRPMDHRIINRELVAVVHLAHYYSAIYLHDNDGIKLDTKVFALLKLNDQCVEQMIKGELGWRLYD